MYLAVNASNAGAQRSFKLWASSLILRTRSKTLRRILKPSNSGKNDMFCGHFFQICAVLAPHRKYC